MKELKDETLPNTFYYWPLFKRKSAYEVHQTAANMINPDLFFALDAGEANDMSGDKKVFGQLGKGSSTAVIRPINGDTWWYEEISP